MGAVEALTYSHICHIMLFTLKYFIRKHQCNTGLLCVRDCSGNSCRKLLLLHKVHSYVNYLTDALKLESEKCYEEK